MRQPSLSPEYNLRRAAEEREKAALCPEARQRDAHLELAQIFEWRACEALSPLELH